MLVASSVDDGIKHHIPHVGDRRPESLEEPGLTVHGKLELGLQEREVGGSRDYCVIHQQENRD